MNLYRTSQYRAGKFGTNVLFWSCFHGFPPCFTISQTWMSQPG
jgi:hypothetical protein